MTNFKYQLPKNWVNKVASFSEFANGATQVSIKVKSGAIFGKILISNCMYIVAMRDHQSLPFEIADIVDIFQTDTDKNPQQKGGWFYWDRWD